MTARQLTLIGATDREAVDELLTEKHYLGPSTRARLVYRDGDGALVFASPASRHLPTTWLELARWCITGGKNAGSMQWSRVVRWLRLQTPATTTVVSYSDPSQGHSGALYRACNWLWAPTWHRIVPPPTGLGSWDGKTRQAVKDRWVFPLRPDPLRMKVLRLEESYIRRFPEAEYTEPRGANYKAFIGRAVEK
jgi:hypothetical protein